MQIEERTCTDCRRTLPISEFYKKGRGHGGASSYFSKCKSCVSKNDLKNRAKIYESHKRYRVKKRLDALMYLSPDGMPKCAVCGFRADLNYLQIDHINDNGAKDKLNCGRRRLGYETCNKILKMKREDARNEYQILCPLHNWAKRLGIGGEQYAVVLVKD